jgi:hypothetical protein
MSRIRPIDGYVRGRMAELLLAGSRAAAEPLAAWMLRRFRLDGKPFSFEGHAFLRAIYDDPSAHLVVMKAAQIGGTVWAVARSFHACIHGLNVIYFFPTRTDVLEFSKSRVGPLIADNPFLSKMMADTDTAGLKRIGSAHLYFRGMQSAVGMKSVPADMLVFDELDEATPDAKTRARERLSHSNYRRILELSNPSLPGYGIDEVFERSDQRHWIVRCPHCAHWTGLESEFPTALGRDVPILKEREDGSVFRCCPRCSGTLDLDTGEWVASYPDRPIRGYLISQLISPIVDPGEILHAYRTTRFPDRFYNLKIGIAWADTQNRLDGAQVFACCGDQGLQERSAEPCVMGVDTGRELHVVISRLLDAGTQRRQIVHIGAHRDYAELDLLMERFNVATCVVDAMPDIHATRGFAKRHERRVWLNYFNEHQKGSPKWDPEQHIVQENRTEALDLSRAVIRERRVVLPRRIPIVDEFAEHLTHDAKRLEEDPNTGAQAYRYVKIGINHFSLAFTYECLAAMKEWSSGPAAGASIDAPPLWRGHMGNDIFGLSRRRREELRRRDEE